MNAAEVREQQAQIRAVDRPILVGVATGPFHHRRAERSEDHRQVGPIDEVASVDTAGALAKVPNIPEKTAAALRATGTDGPAQPADHQQYHQQSERETARNSASARDEREKKSATGPMRLAAQNKGQNARFSVCYNGSVRA